MSNLDQLRRFLGTGQAAQSAVDLAIHRAELVRLVRERRDALTATRLKRDDDVTDAQLRLAMAETALDDFDRRASRAPAISPEAST